MTSSDRPQPEDLLAAYLDGTLSLDEQQQFEQRLSQDPELRAELELARRIDASLRKQFAAPRLPASWDFVAEESTASGPQPLSTVSADQNGRLLNADASVGGSERHGSRRAALWAVAASIMWLAVLWQLWPRSEPAYTWRSLDNIYVTRVTAGFEADWLCSDARQFATTFLDRQRQPLLLGPMPAGTTMVGLAYIPGISERTTTLMCRVDGKPVMVFVDRLADDIRPDLEFAKAQPAGLNVFRKELAGLALYELTPWDSPRVVDVLYVPSEIPPVGTPTVQ